MRKKTGQTLRRGLLSLVLSSALVIGAASPYLAETDGSLSSQVQAPDLVLAGAGSGQAGASSAQSEDLSGTADAPAVTSPDSDTDPSAGGKTDAGSETGADTDPAGADGSDVSGSIQAASDAADDDHDQARSDTTNFPDGNAAGSRTAPETASGSGKSDVPATPPRKGNRGES